MSKPFAWSFTALTNFETCPKQYYHLKVAKDTPDPPGEAALWGQRVHKALELRVKERTPLPDSLSGYEVMASKFDNLPGTILVEQQLCLNQDFRPTKWFAKDAWLRVVIDLAVINKGRMGLFDWKTGKRKPDNAQLKLFAATAFKVYDDIDVAHTGFVWLQDKKIDTEKFQRMDEGRIWQEFLPRVHRMEKAFETQNWPARPSGLCRKHCAVFQCEHNGRKGA